MTSHTILLLQFSSNKASRTYSEHETVAMAMEELIRVFENKLKELNPSLRNLTYELKDLQKYIDHLTDAVALVFDNRTMSYIPHDKAWLKDKIYSHLQKSASSR